MPADHSEDVSVETDIWLPMHQELVSQGKINSWALYHVKYGDRSKCDYYTVTTYLGGEQLNSDPAFGEVFSKVHPGKDMTRAMVATLSSRDAALCTPPRLAIGPPLTFPMKDLTSFVTCARLQPNRFFEI